MSALPAAVTPLADVASGQWLRSLRASGVTRDEAVERLHALLLRAARFEAARRCRRLPHLRDQLEEIAHEAAGDALISVLARLDEFRGDSRFTTWVYKFAVLETAVKLRKRAWQARELPLEPDTWNLFASVELGPEERAEQNELLSTLETAIGELLTPHQRRVLVALTLDRVEILPDHPVTGLLVDYHLDRGNGIAAIRDIRRRFGDTIPAILITADRSPAVQLAARDENVAVLNKPVKPASLRALLGQWRTQQMVAAE